MLSAFQLLFEDDSRDDPSLPEDIRAIYSGDWHLPDTQQRPYIYSNFAMSRDGRVSFNESGHLGGGDVSGFNQHDQWLMALLRARADAVVVGDKTLQIEPEHLWTSDYIYPQDPTAFVRLRNDEDRTPYPLQVFLSFHGDFDTSARVFCQPDAEIIIATTEAGHDRALALDYKARVSILNLGQQSVDVAHLVDVLHGDFGVRTLLCEGGPRVYGGFIAAHRIDEEFLTLCPTVIGNDQRLPSAPRPGLVEGQAFMPLLYPKSLPLSMRRAEQHLFLRSRFQYP